MKEKKLQAVSFGRIGEELACLHLRLKGYQILERNIQTGVGEVDIIARKRKTLCFIEVKSRSNLEAALQALSKRQQNRITNAAKSFISCHDCYGDHDIRFDFIAITPNQWPKHLKHAWWEET